MPPGMRYLPEALHVGIHLFRISFLNRYLTVQYPEISLIFPIFVTAKTFLVEQERDILERLGQGDRTAFDTLYLHYAPKLEELAYWMLKDRAEAEDVMQSVLLRVWERREEIARMERFSNYLFTMTKNAIFDIYKHSLIHEKYKTSRLASVSYFRDDSLDKQVESDDLALLIAVAVAKMPDQRRRIFRMSRYEGLANREIAERLSISIKTVENHITAALSQLRHLLAAVSLFF